MFDDGNYDYNPDEFNEDEGWDEDTAPQGPVSDDEWARTPKRWSTMLMLTQLNAGRQHTERELVDACIALLSQARFECSWSEKYGEMVFWPSDVPLDEVKREVI